MRALTPGFLGAGLFPPGSHDQLVMDLLRAHEDNIATLNWKGQPGGQDLLCVDFYDATKFMDYHRYPAMAIVAERIAALAWVGDSIPAGGPMKNGQQRTHVRRAKAGQRATPGVSYRVHFDDTQPLFAGNEALELGELDPEGM